MIVKTCKKIAFLLSICCVLAGCGDYYSRANRGSDRVNYLDVIGRRGEPREVIRDGHGGGIMSWSPLPIHEVMQSPPHSVMRLDVYRVNSHGNVYR
jgi:hypothetical protein